MSKYNHQSRMESFSIPPETPFIGRLIQNWFWFVNMPMKQAAGG